MAFDGTPTKLIGEAVAGGKAIASRAGAWSASIWPHLVKAGWGLRWLISGLPIVRWFSRSLAKRIVFSNLVGLAILLGGYLYLNQYKDWLVDAKVDSLTAQGEIIAQAIAANATSGGPRTVWDPEAIPEIGFPPPALRGDDFASLSFSIGPEKVAPVLRRMMQPDIRARVYNKDGRLIVDTNDFLSRRTLSPPDQDSSAEKPKTKNVWTRMTAYLFVPDLPVLREIDRANGNYYAPVRSAMAGTGTPMLLLNEDGNQIVSYAAPIRRAERIHGVLLLSTDPNEIEKVLNKERNALLKVAGLALITSILVSLLLAYSVAGPIHNLSEAAQAVSHDLNARHKLPDFATRSDEVAQLARSFKAMTASLYRRIEASEKFAADVAHELKNPLTAASSTAQSLTYARNDAERDHLVSQIRGELKRLNKLISDVSNASRLDAELALQQREPVDVGDVLDNVVATFRDIVAGSGRTIVLDVEKHGADDLMVLGQDGRLGQVATNLIDNALSFSPDSGRVWVKAYREGNRVRFVIEDEGPGIEQSKLETVFERFYTYRPTANTSRGGNSGLGLSISREIVLAHDGQIWAENRAAGSSGSGSPSGDGTAVSGARFIVDLPAAVKLTTGRSAARFTRHG
jgi:two-component system sensor histidine kinase ChvG